MACLLGAHPWRGRRSLQLDPNQQDPGGPDGEVFLQGVSWLAPLGLSQAAVPAVRFPEHSLGFFFSVSVVVLLLPVYYFLDYLFTCLFIWLRQFLVAPQGVPTVSCGLSHWGAWAELLCLES